MSKKMTYLVAETRESIKGLCATRLNETVTANKSKIKYSTDCIISTNFHGPIRVISVISHAHLCIHICTCVIHVLSTEGPTKSQENDSYSSTNLNTLKTGLLNCLNARSRGLTLRHRASCI